MVHSTRTCEFGPCPLAKKSYPSLRSHKKDGRSPTYIHATRPFVVILKGRLFGIRDLQYTSNESHAVRTVGPDIQVFDPSDWIKGVIDKLKVEGLSSVSLSPGKNPSIAVFVGERKVCTISFCRVQNCRMTVCVFMWCESRGLQRALGYTALRRSRRPQHAKRHSTRQTLQSSNGMLLGHKCCS